MYKVFINGELKKITKSFRCVEAIIKKFASNYVEGSLLIVEKDGKNVFEFSHF